MLKSAIVTYDLRYKFAKIKWLQIPFGCAVWPLYHICHNIIVKFTVAKWVYLSTMSKKRNTIHPFSNITLKIVLFDRVKLGNQFLENSQVVGSFSIKYVYILLNCYFWEQEIVNANQLEVGTVLFAMILIYYREWLYNSFAVRTS